MGEQYPTCFWTWKTWNFRFLGSCHTLLFGPGAIPWLSCEVLAFPILLPLSKSRVQLNRSFFKVQICASHSVSEHSLFRQQPPCLCGCSIRAPQDVQCWCWQRAHLCCIVYVPLCLADLFLKHCQKDQPRCRCIGCISAFFAVGAHTFMDRPIYPKWWCRQLSLISGWAIHLCCCSWSLTTQKREHSRRRSVEERWTTLREAPAPCSHLPFTSFVEGGRLCRGWGLRQVPLPVQMASPPWMASTHWWSPFSRLVNILLGGGS